MAKTKISTIAKDLNISVATVYEFLRKKDISIDENINTRIEDDVVRMLNAEFSHDQDLKNKSTQFTSDRKEHKATQKSEGKKVEDQTLQHQSANKPRILGILEFDNNGKPIVKSVESSAAEKANDQKAVQPEMPAESAQPKSGSQDS